MAFQELRKAAREQDLSQSQSSHLHESSHLVWQRNQGAERALATGSLDHTTTPKRRERLDSGGYRTVERASDASLKAYTPHLVSELAGIKEMISSLKIQHTNQETNNIPHKGLANSYPGTSNRSRPTSADGAPQFDSEGNQHLRYRSPFQNESSSKVFKQHTSPEPSHGKSAQHHSKSKGADHQDNKAIQFELKELRRQVELLRVSTPPHRSGRKKHRAKSNCDDDDTQVVLRLQESLQLKLRRLEDQEAASRQAADKSQKQAEEARANLRLIEHRNQELTTEVHNIRRQLQGVKREGQEEIERVEKELQDARARLANREAEERGAQAALKSVRLQISKLVPTIYGSASKMKARSRSLEDKSSAKDNNDITVNKATEEALTALQDLRGLLERLRLAKAQARDKENIVRKAKKNVAQLCEQIQTQSQTPVRCPPSENKKRLGKELRNAQGSLIRVAEAILREGTLLRHATERLQQFHAAENSRSEQHNRIQGLQESSKQCQTINEGLASKVAKMQAALAQERRRFAQEMSDVQQAMEKIKSSASEHRTKAARFIAEAPQLENKIATLKKEIEDTEAGLRRTHDRTEALNFRTQSFTRMVSHMNHPDTQNGLDGDLEELETETREAVQEASKARKGLAKVKKNLTLETGRLESRRIARADLDRAIRGLTDEASYLREQLSELAQSAASNEQAAALTGALTGSKEFGDMSSRLHSAKQENSRLQETVVQLRQSVEEAKVQNVALSQEVEHHHATIKQLKEQTHKQHERFAEFQAAIEQNDLMRGRLVSLSHDANEAQHELRTLLEQETQHKEKFKHIDSRIEELKSLVARLHRAKAAKSKESNILPQSANSPSHRNRIRASPSLERIFQDQTYQQKFF